MTAHVSTEVEKKANMDYSLYVYGKKKEKKQTYMNFKFSDESKGS